MDFSLLQKHAIPLNADTLIRQGRKVPSNLERYWTRYFHEASRTESAETWAAFVGDSLDQFKTGMGFRRAPAGQRLELAGWVRPLVNRFTIPRAERVLRSFGKGETTAKLDGILRWYQPQPSLHKKLVQSRAA